VLEPERQQPVRAPVQEQAPVRELEQEQVLLPGSKLEQLQTPPTDPPVEELPARLTKLLHSSARLASSSCILPGPEQ